MIVGEETLGSDTGYLEELKEMVRQFGLEESVIFAGFQKNIPEVMRAMDIVVMPSREETFGLVAIVGHGDGNSDRDFQGRKLHGDRG